MKYRRNAAILAVVLALIFLPVVDCIGFSAGNDHMSFGQSIDAGKGDTVSGSTTISQDALSTSLSASAKRPTLNLKDSHKVSNSAGSTAEVSVNIKKAKSYKYTYDLQPGDDVVQASETLDVNSALSCSVYAKAVNAAGYDVKASTTIANGDLLGYHNMAQASSNIVGAFQKFDKASATAIQCNLVSYKLPMTQDVSIESKEKNTVPEATINTLFSGTVSDYLDKALISTERGTLLDQSAHVEGSFIGTSTAGSATKTRTSNYGSEYDIDMNAKLDDGISTASGTLAYYVYPKKNQKIQKAVDLSQSGDTINVAPGTYKEKVVVNKPVTVRGDGVKVNSISSSNGGTVYLDSKKILLRADDFYWNSAPWLWFIDLIDEKQIKGTCALVPVDLEEDWNQDMPWYLWYTDTDSVEQAVHGYTHDDFTEMTYEEQYGELQKAKDVMNDNFLWPTTFVAPYNNGNLDTLQALEAAGFLSYSGNYVDGYDGDVGQFSTIYCLESDWNGNHPLPHISADDFANVWGWLSQEDDYICLYLHPHTYLDENGLLSTEETDKLSACVDFLKTQNVEFMTIEQANKWKKWTKG